MSAASSDPKPPSDGSPSTAPEPPTSGANGASEHGPAPATATNGALPSSDVENNARALYAQPKSLRSTWLAAQGWPRAHVRAVRERVKVLNFEAAKTAYEHAEREREAREIADEMRGAQRPQQHASDPRIPPPAALPGPANSTHHQTNDARPPRTPKTELAFERGDHAELALTLLDSLRSLRYADLVYDEGSLFGAGPTIWEEVPPARLSQIVQGYAGALIGIDTEEPRTLRISRGDVTGTIGNLYDLCARPAFFSEAPAGIAFADGFAVVTVDGIDLRPHSPRYRARFAYPFALPREGELPERFLQFCNDVFLPDADREEKILAIQEHLGACITGIAPTYERAMLFVGEAGTGKSRLTRFFSAAMPPGCVTGLPPSLMHDQYALPRLVGSRLNVVPDIGREVITASVKGIVSGELRTVRSPGQAAFDLRPRAGHLFGVNPPMPELEDTGSGMERRWIIITFHRVFRNGDPKRDPDIAEKIIAKDLAQLVRWGLDGAVRLQRQREHTLPPSHDLALDSWLRRADPVRWFVDHALLVGGGWTRATELHVALVAWLESLGERCPVALQGLGPRLEKLGVAASQRNYGPHSPNSPNETSTGIAKLSSKEFWDLVAEKRGTA
jgi:hypothetical protein